MGWFTSDYPEHEGYLVGLVYRRHPNGDLCTGIYRELAYPEDVALADSLPGRIIPVDALKAACGCGWRSARWEPARCLKAAEWFPSCVDASEHDEQIALQRWEEHLAVEHLRKMVPLDVRLDIEQLTPAKIVAEAAARFLTPQKVQEIHRAALDARDRRLGLRR